jgi:cytochrome c oxidase cbb3-type subunit III
MQVRNRVIAGAMVGLTLAVAVRVTAQAQPPTQPPVQTPPAQPPIEGHGGPPPPGTQPATPAPTPAQPRPGSGQARFPAHQRPSADPVVVERGRGVYSGVCSACHGVDARGGQLGGPNLLRSQLMLNDRDGELMLPVVQNGRPGTTMPPFPTISADDIKAIAAWIHSLQAQGSNQGGPPPGEEPVLNILVGDAKAGEAFFTATCTKCHSATGDLAGIATRISDPKALQNAWVSGGLAGSRGGGRASGAPPRPATPRTTVTAKVTLPGETVEGALVRVDDFTITVALADGTRRTIRRDGDVPKVEITDPRAEHRTLLTTYSDKNMHDVTAYLATIK